MSNAVCERQVEIIRPNSYGFCGGNWGDEGKAKVIDQIDGEVFYRDNGGSNAGHTIELEDGRKIVLHHLPSGVGREKATVILAKGMVIHPKELVYEIDEARDFFGGKIARIKIDEEASLCLDTHRAYEGALKKRANGSKGSTGRGIGPAYVDELNRNELKMKELLLDVVKPTGFFINCHYPGRFPWTGMANLMIFFCATHPRGMSWSALMHCLQ